MLYDFTYYNPTKIYFGKKSMDNLSKELQNYGKNILLLYGKNSIKKITRFQPRNPFHCRHFGHIQVIPFPLL